MSQQKKKSADEDFFEYSKLPTHIFRAGDVEEILGIERWRLAKFLTGKQYRLSPSAQIGRGPKPWRIFSHQDLYRLAIANRMVEDGFTAKFVSMVLQEIEDRELLEADSRGESTSPDIGIVRTSEGPTVRLMGPHLKQGLYYVLKLSELIKDVDREILRHRRETTGGEQ